MIPDQLDEANKRKKEKNAKNRRNCSLNPPWSINKKWRGGNFIYRNFFNPNLRWALTLKLMKNRKNSMSYDLLRFKDPLQKEMICTKKTKISKLKPYPSLYISGFCIY